MTNAPKSKRGKVTVFGSHSAWRKATDASGYVLYKKEAKKGATGAYYPGFFIYHDIKTMKSYPVDVRLTWMGGKNLNDDTKRSWANKHFNVLQFRKNKVGVTAQGYGIDRFNVQLIAKGASVKKFPLSFWDIDQGKTLSFGSDGGKFTRFYYNPTTFVKYRSPYNFVRAASGRSEMDPRGSVNSDDSRGAFTGILNSNNVNVDYGRHDAFTTIKQARQQLDNDAAQKATPGAKFTPTKKVSISSIMGSKNAHSWGNLFQINMKSNVPPWQPQVKKYAGNSINGPWTTNLTLDNAENGFYYNIQSKMLWPAGNAGDKYGANNAVFADNDIDPALKFSKSDVKVYYQIIKGGKMHAVPNQSQYFNVTVNNYHLKVVTTKKALQKSGKFTVFNKILNVIWKVKPDKNAFNKAKNGKLVGIWHNRALYTINQPGNPPDITPHQVTTTTTVTGGSKEKLEPVEDPGKMQSIPTQL